MDGAHGVRPAEIEQIVVAAHLAVPGVEARAAKAFLVEPERLDHRAHGAVEHQNALGGETAQRRFGLDADSDLRIDLRRAPSRPVTESARARRRDPGRRPSKWQIA